MCGCSPLCYFVDLRDQTISSAFSKEELKVLKQREKGRIEEIESDLKFSREKEGRLRRVVSSRVVGLETMRREMEEVGEFLTLANTMRKGEEEGGNEDSGEEGGIESKREVIQGVYDPNLPLLEQAKETVTRKLSVEEEARQRMEELQSSGLLFISFIFNHHLI